MRGRFAHSCLVVALVVAAGFAVTPVASATHLPGPCDFHRQPDETLRHFSKRQIRCAVRRFGPVPGGAPTAICIADRESGLNPGAASLTGQYLGLYQHAALYWDERYRTWALPEWQLPTSALEGRTNAIVTIRMVRGIGAWGTAGWPRHDC